MNIMCFFSKGCYFNTTPLSAAVKVQGFIGWMGG